MTDKPEAASEIAEIRLELAAEREKFTMHTAQVHAWFSALIQEMGIASEGDTVDVATSCSKAMDWVEAKAAEAERLRVALTELAAALDHESDQQGGKARVLARLFDAHALLAEVK